MTAFITGDLKMQIQDLCKKAHYKKIEQLRRRINCCLQAEQVAHSLFLEQVNKSLNAKTLEEHNTRKEYAKLLLNHCINYRQKVRILKSEMYLQTHFYEV